MPLKKLNFETIQREADQFKLQGTSSYIESYPEFINYFNSIDKIEKHHLIISIHFVYGWMPTIINLNTTDLDKVLSLLNRVKNGQILKKEELEVLKSCINNSMVGLSKLLHFINPKEYAIWDSRIYRFLTEKKHSYGIGKPELYLKYIKGIKEIIQHKDYPKIHKEIEQYFEYKIEPMRAIEIIMFEADKKRTNAEKRLTYSSGLGLRKIETEQK